MKDQTFEVGAHFWIRLYTGRRNLDKEYQLKLMISQIEQKYNKAVSRSGLRKEHGAYLELKSQLELFVTGPLATAENISRKLVDSKTNLKSLIAEERQMREQSLAFVKMTNSKFDFYPDLIRNVQDATAEVLFGLRIALNGKIAQVQHFKLFPSSEKMDDLDCLEMELYSTLSKKDKHDDLIEILRFLSKKWSKEADEIEAKKNEATAQFKFKQLDMGETVEAQEEIEEQEFSDFFMTDHEFKSEQEGPDLASKDPLGKYEKFVDIFRNLGSHRPEVNQAKIDSIKLRRLLHEKLKDNSGRELDEDDSALTRLILIDLCVNTSGESSDRFTDNESDIYRRSNPAEAISTIPLLRSLCSRVSVLLEQFPEHPTLMSIKQSAERMFSLSLFVPVITLCTGIELVLSRVNDWNINAPSALSLRDETEKIWAQVVEWRKRELHQWKNILENAIELEARKISKIFPQLFLSLDSDDLEVFRLATVNFIIQAKCSDFKARLQMLEKFVFLFKELISFYL